MAIAQAKSALQTLVPEMRRLAGVRRAIIAEVKRLGWREEVRTAWDESEKALSELVRINEQAVKLWRSLMAQGKVSAPTFVTIDVFEWTNRHYGDGINGLGSFITKTIGVILFAASIVAAIVFFPSFLIIIPLLSAAFAAYLIYMTSAQDKALALAKLGRDPKDLPGNNRDSGTGIGDTITSVGTLAVIGIGLLLVSQLVGRK